MTIVTNYGMTNLVLSWWVQQQHDTPRNAKQNNDIN